MTKRKPTYAQALALEKAQAAARRAARARQDAREAQARAELEARQEPVQRPYVCPGCDGRVRHREFCAEGHQARTPVVAPGQ